MAMSVERLHEEDTKTERMVDRLSDMPESLQLCILSSLDARHAVQTMVLSKSWVSSWTCISVLNFSSDIFKQLHVFYDFVANALSRRQPMKLNRLTFKRGGTCRGKVLEKVFDYAFSHGVEELEANVVPTMDSIKSWRWSIRSSNLLTSLKLQIRYHVVCSFLEPKSVVGSFKNLTNLHLETVIITGFRVYCSSADIVSVGEWMFTFSGFKVFEAGFYFTPYIHRMQLVFE